MVFTPVEILVKQNKDFPGIFYVSFIATGRENKNVIDARSTVNPEKCRMKLIKRFNDIRILPVIEWKLT